MFAVLDIDTADTRVPQTLRDYLDIDFIAQAKFSKASDTYTTIEHGMYHQYYGLKSWLKRRYYPNHTHSVRKFKKGHVFQIQGSSAQRGTMVDRQLSYYIVDQTRAGKKRRKKSGPRKRPWDPLTLAIIRYFKCKGHVIVATQVPVLLRRIKRMTEADVLTVDVDGKLYMWEIKTAGVALTRGKTSFEPPIESVPCNKVNQWELQRLYTHRGMVEEGLNLHKSHVLHACMKHGRPCVRAMPHPKWLKRLEPVTTTTTTTTAVTDEGKDQQVAVKTT